MGTIANAKVTHYYNCYNGDFIGCLLTPDLSQVPMEWEKLSDVHLDDTRTLHDLNRGKKKIKSEIDIPEINLKFQ